MARLLEDSFFAVSKIRQLPETTVREKPILDSQQASKRELEFEKCVRFGRTFFALIFNQKVLRVKLGLARTLSWHPASLNRLAIKGLSSSPRR